MIDFIRAALLTLIEALCCRIFCETFLEKGMIGKKTERLLFCWLFAGFLAISMVPYVHYLGKAVLAVLVIAVIAKMNYENSLLKIFFVSAGYYGMVLCIDRIMLIAISRVYGKEAGYLFADPVKGTVVALACKTVLFLAVVFMKKKFGTTGSLNLIEDKDWVRFLFFPLITVVCMLAFAMDENPSGKAVSVTSFSLVFLNFLVFYMIQNVVEKEKVYGKCRLQGNGSKAEWPCMHIWKKYLKNSAKGRMNIRTR